MKISALRELVQQEIEAFIENERVHVSKQPLLYAFTDYLTAWLTRVLDYTSIDEEIRELTQTLLLLITQLIKNSSIKSPENITAQFKENLNKRIFRKIDNFNTQLYRKNPSKNYPQRYLQIHHAITTAIQAYRSEQKKYLKQFGMVFELTTYCNNAIVELERLLDNFANEKLFLNVGKGQNTIAELEMLIKDFDEDKFYLYADEKVKILIGLTHNIIKEAGSSNFNRLILDLKKIVNEQASLEKWTEKEKESFYNENYLQFAKNIRTEKSWAPTYGLVEERLRIARENQQENPASVIPYPEDCRGSPKTLSYLQNVKRLVEWEDYKEKVNKAWEQDYHFSNSDDGNTSDNEVNASETPLTLRVFPRRRLTKETMNIVINGNKALKKQPEKTILKKTIPSSEGNKSLPPSPRIRF